MLEDWKGIRGEISARICLTFWIQIRLCQDVMILLTGSNKNEKDLTRLTYNCAHLRLTKEKKEENIWRRKIFFAEGTIKGGGKGG